MVKAKKKARQWVRKKGGTLAPRHAHRMTCEDMEEMSGDPCGYIRNPYTNDQRNRIYGTCAFDGGQCKNNRFPHDKEDCKPYTNWREYRAKEIAK